MFAKKNLLIVALASMVCCLALAGSVLGDGIKVYPQNFNLNSYGVTEPVAVAIDLCVPEGYVLADYDASFAVNGVLVVGVSSMEWIVDEYGVGQLWAYFDRAVIRAYMIEEKLLGTVTVQVTGSFSVANDTETLEFTFSGVDDIDVVAPGNKLDLVF